MRPRITNALLVRGLLVLGLLGLVRLAGAQAPAPDEIKIKGKDEYKLSADGAAYKLRGPGEQRRMLRREGQDWVLTGGDKKIALRARRAADGAIRVSDGKGATVHELHPREAGFTLDGPDGKLVWRIKVKEDKVNVYDGTGARRYHVKQKDDGISIHDEKEQIWKLKGLSSLAEAACFALPVDMGEAALLYLVQR